MFVYFKKLNQDAVIPEYKSKQAAGLDLSVVEEISVGNDVILAPTGLSVEIPEGYFGMLVPRSSLCIKHKVMLANNVGIIDSDYRGEIKVALVSIDTGKSVIVPKGERIAQMIIVPCGHISGNVFSFKVEEENGSLSETERGAGGFGSTGAK